MNILVLSWRDHKHPQAGGAEQVMHEHLKGWIEAGHKVTLFSSRFSGSQKREHSKNMEILHSGDQYIGVKINAFKFWLKNHKKFDLVVDQFHGIPFFTPFYIRKPKLAVLQEVAREVWFLNGFPIPFSWIVGVLGYIFEPLLFIFYKRVPFMVGSLSAKKDLIKFGIPETNINIICHGVIPPTFTTTDRKSKIKTVMYLGALTEDKGAEDVIKTFSLLDRSGKFNFWVVGKGPLTFEKHLKNLSKELVKNNKVIFWKFVDQKKKFELLSKSHLLINPSIREGWGLVNIEANLVGTPVIAYKSAGLVDSVKNGISGVITKKNDPKSMAGEVIKLLENKNLYQNLSDGAQKWSKKFNWKSSKSKSLNLIIDIASNFY